MFEQMTVEIFGNTVMLQGIVCGESSFCAVVLQVIVEIMIQVLPPLVTMKPFDLNTMLSPCPRRKVLVGLKGVVFAMEELDNGPGHCVIGEGSVVFLLVDCLGRAWFLNIRVDLVSKYGSPQL